jgi:hypothetical protein
MPATIKIKLPDKYLLNESLIDEFRLLNLDLQIDSTNNNILVIEELAFDFDDCGIIELKFPAWVFPNSNFEELYELNIENDTLNFEQPGNHSIILKMGTYYSLKIIEMAIGASLYNWATMNKTGTVPEAHGEYYLNGINKPKGRSNVYMADVSFISFEKVSEEVQDSWEKRALVAPTLCIEFVSSKYGLKPDLRKMENVWMQHGTDVGVVVCPFSKKLFIFQKGITDYTEQSIYEPFTHPLLPGYSGDFSIHVNKIK